MNAHIQVTDQHIQQVFTDHLLMTSRSSKTCVLFFMWHFSYLWWCSPGECSMPSLFFSLFPPSLWLIEAPIQSEQDYCKNLITGSYFLFDLPKSWSSWHVLSGNINSSSHWLLNLQCFLPRYPNIPTCWLYLCVQVWISLFLTFCVSPKSHPVSPTCKFILAATLTTPHIFLFSVLAEALNM